MVGWSRREEWVDCTGGVGAGKQKYPSIHPSIHSFHLRARPLSDNDDDECEENRKS